MGSPVREDRLHHYFELVFINEAAPGREAVAPIFSAEINTIGSADKCPTGIFRPAVLLTKYT